MGKPPRPERFPSRPGPRKGVPGLRRGSPLCYDRKVKVELSDTARETIEALVRDGGYETPAEAVEAAVNLLAAKQRARSEQLRQLVEEGRRDIEEGRSILLTEESAAELKARIASDGHARLAARRPS